MAGDDYYTTYEAALAVVATGMKKARLPYNILVLNSILGGMFFLTGGMLQIMIEGNLPGINANNPGIARMLNGLFYPIGLFFVVQMGVDLFNSNILFFTVAGCRKAVTIIDLIIAWITSYWLNLVGNIFVCYIFVHFLGLFDDPRVVEFSRQIVEQRANTPFHQTLIRGIAGNFYVCLGIYLQLLARPVHVKLLMLALPLFTFVLLGFVHLIAEITVGIIGLINGCNTLVGKVAYNLFLPALIGNMIGGLVFGVVVVWYLHLYSVERDAKRLKLPRLVAKDVQPNILMDSRIVREEMPATAADPTGDERVDALYHQAEKLSKNEEHPPELARKATGALRRSMALLRRTKLPRNVFPVAGMAPADERELRFAGNEDDDDDNDNDADSADADLFGERIRRYVTGIRNKRKLITHQDIELHLNQSFQPPSSTVRLDSPVVKPDRDVPYEPSIDSSLS